MRAALERVASGRALAHRALIAPRRSVSSQRVALLLELERQLLAARAHDPPAGEHVHAVRHDVVEQALVVRDHQHRALGLAQRVHAARHDAQRVDVEARVGLVEDREARLEERHLEDLVALLLAAREALVDRRAMRFSSISTSFAFSRTSGEEVHRVKRLLAAAPCGSR